MVNRNRVAAVAMACALGAVAAATAAGVQGTAKLDGPPPKRYPLQMNADPKCAAMHQGKTVLAEDTLVDAKGGLANVFVWVENPPRGHPRRAGYPGPPRAARLPLHPARAGNPGQPEARDRQRRRHAPQRARAGGQEPAVQHRPAAGNRPPHQDLHHHRAPAQVQVRRPSLDVRLPLRDGPSLLRGLGRRRIVHPPRATRRHLHPGGLAREARRAEGAGHGGRRRLRRRPRSSSRRLPNRRSSRCDARVSRPLSSRLLLALGIAFAARAGAGLRQPFGPRHRSQRRAASRRHRDRARRGAAAREPDHHHRRRRRLPVVAASARNLLASRSRATDSRSTPSTSCGPASTRP